VETLRGLIETLLGYDPGTQAGFEFALKWFGPDVARRLMTVRIWGAAASIVFLISGFVLLPFTARYMRTLGVNLDTSAEQRRAILDARYKRVCFGVYATYYVVYVMLIVSIIIGIGVWLVGQLFARMLWLMHGIWFFPVALAAVYVLYILRTKLRYAYAFVEIIAGLAAISTALLDPRVSDLGQASAVLGGIYIVIRGLDNLDQSLDEVCHVLPADLATALQALWSAFKLDRQVPTPSAPAAPPQPAT